MNPNRSLLIPVFLAGAAVLGGTLLSAVPAMAQCPLPELASGLQIPLGITQSNAGNLLVSESGLGAPNTGRISIVDLEGSRRTLLAGLPSGINDIGDPSGPAGLFMFGRTLYVAIGVGDAVKIGPALATNVPNPNPSSPILSSVLAVHFSAHAENATTGFTLGFPDQLALASGEKVSLSDSAGNKLTIELAADFPNFIPLPLPNFSANVAGSNPYDLVRAGNYLYVTDGGQNRLWKIDLASGSQSVLAEFPNVPNPLFGTVGGPVEQAVPTGIAYAGGQLFVTLFRGVPFAPGTSVVEQVDPKTGSHKPLITGLKTAIDVLPLARGRHAEYLVLQHASIGPFFSGPGLLLRFSSSDGEPALVTDCLSRPTAMVLDERTGTIYVTELAGRISAVNVVH